MVGLSGRQPRMPMVYSMGVRRTGARAETDDNNSEDEAWMMIAEEEEMWLRVMRDLEATIEWVGSAQEFLEAEGVAEGARAHWEAGVTEAQARRRSSHCWSRSDDVVLALK